jgi:hypothetical protein
MLRVLHSSAVLILFKQVQHRKEESFVQVAQNCFFLTVLGFTFIPIPNMWV